MASSAWFKASELQSPIDRRVLPAYATLCVGVLLTALFSGLGGFRFVDPTMILPGAWAGMLLFAGLLARRYGMSRLGGACESIAIVYSQSLVMLASLPMITAYSAPLADKALAAVDHALGFDWPSYAMLFRDHRLVLKSIELAYMSFTWEPAVILIALFALGQDDRAWRFVVAAGIALLVTVGIFPFAPAAGAFVHFGISHAAYPNLHTDTPWSFAPAILAMKSGTKLIDGSLMVGYVSFPSYHAASALLFTWAAWRLGMARWFFVFVNVCMAAAAIIVGAHYLIDIIGGLLVAAVSLALAARVTSATCGDGRQGA